MSYTKGEIGFTAAVVSVSATLGTAASSYMWNRPILKSSTASGLGAGLAFTSLGFFCDKNDAPPLTISQVIVDAGILLATECGGQFLLSVGSDITEALIDTAIGFPITVGVLLIIGMAFRGLGHFQKNNIAESVSSYLPVLLGGLYGLNRFS